MHEIIEKPILSAATRILHRLIRPDSRVVEIGSNDASFRNNFNVASWTTVDKYRTPDVQVDFSLVRLKEYLKCAEFRSIRWHKVPVTIPLACVSLTIPAWVLPLSFPDFLLVEASPAKDAE